ncbi:MAG: S8 family serine peptidase [Candidatus Cloacimonetes bacterium]|nr:S8 family serine peptidase [Candidatus Cloacimonadota bacterium]
MKRFILIISILCLALGLGAAADLDLSSGNRPAYASDLVKIKLSREAAQRSRLPQQLGEEFSRFGHSDLDRIMAETGGTAVIRAHRRLKNKAWEDAQGFDRWFLVRLAGKATAEEALAAFKASPWIEDASFEHFAYPQFTPNDPYYDDNWGHNNTGQGPGGGGAGFDSNAPEAWDDSQFFGDPNIIIAIIDSGVNYNHEDLNDNCVTGYDYGSNDNDPQDTNGHGSQCAGVAAGEANNGIGVAGVAGGCSIMPIKVMSSSGSMTFTSITNGITHAADNGAHVISMSLGAENGTDEGDNPACDAALYYAYNAGCVIFAATANSDISMIAYPSNHTSVISVGAASPTGQRKSSSSSDGQNWWGSNYGVNVQDDPKAVDIMAATILPATTRTGGYSTNFNGTSCATPYAAGVAGLVLSKDSGLTPDQVRQAIVNSATDMTIDGGAGWDRYTGYGMINASGAVASIAPGMPSCVITEPANNSVHSLGTTVLVAVNANDSDGFISHVNFILDDNATPEFTDAEAPFAWNWNTSGIASGAHTITAVAYDNLSNNRSYSIEVILLQAANEGFESGLFDLYPWQNPSSGPWTIQSETVYSGSHAAQSGTITHLQESALSLTLTVVEAGAVSFFSKVSSEPNYDFLRFYIDGALQDEWSGLLNWEFHSYPVTAGTRTFTWTYYKDQGVSTGSDCAWLDHISFPAHNAPPFAPSGLTATAVSPSKIVLHWTDNSSDETEFYVERSTGGYWSLINWAGADVTSAEDTGLDPDTNYSYRVRAFNANGGSNYSNVSSAMTLGNDCPDNVSATQFANWVNLSWDAPLSGADGYQIKRFEVINGNPANGVLITPTNVTETSFTDPDWYLLNPSCYLWQVQAVAGSSVSEGSGSNPLSKEANGVIVGTVTDLSGAPLENATIFTGTVSALTNEYGVYTLSVVPENYTLTASHPDYESVTQTGVAVSSDLQTQADFQLPLYTVATPTFSPEAGAYTGSVDVVLSSATPGSEIRFTLDGTEPCVYSQLYAAPIHLETSATVRAKAFKLNCTPSDIAEAFYEVTVAADDPAAPAVAGIQGVWPNPFSTHTRVNLYLKDSSRAYSLDIYNIRGELVRRYQGREKGYQDLVWDAKDNRGRPLAAGVYLLRFAQGDLRQTRKLVLK